MILQIIGCLVVLTGGCYMGYKRGQRAREEVIKTGGTTDRLVNDLFG